MNLKPVVIGFLFFSGLTGKGQSFKWHAQLEKVKASGFYNIALTPDLVSKTEDPEMADIRIFEKDREIAWLLRKAADSAGSSGPVIPSPYSPVPIGALKVKEIRADRQSVAEISFNNAYQVNKLKLTVAGFKFYRREAWLAEIPPGLRPESGRSPFSAIKNFIILSGKPAIIDLPGEKRYKQLYLIIENEDNSPLFIKKIEAYQQNMHLTAYLEKDKTYTIKTGQSGMRLPVYDLSYFNDSISSRLPFVKVGNFKQNKVKVQSGASFFTGKVWIWGALTALIAVLAYLSHRMINEMQKKK